MAEANAKKLERDAKEPYKSESTPAAAPLPLPLLLRLSTLNEMEGDAEFIWQEEASVE